MGSLGGSPALQLASSAAVGLALPLSPPGNRVRTALLHGPQSRRDERRGAGGRVNVHKELLGFCWKRF